MEFDELMKHELCDFFVALFAIIRTVKSIKSFGVRYNNNDIYVTNGGNTGRYGTYYDSHSHICLSTEIENIIHKNTDLLQNIFNRIQKDYPSKTRTGYFIRYDDATKKIAICRNTMCTLHRMNIYYLPFYCGIEQSFPI